jgi:hypothetical protein
VEFLIGGREVLLPLFKEEEGRLSGCRGPAAVKLRLPKYVYRKTALETLSAGV